MQPDKDGDQMPSTSPDAEGKCAVPDRQQALPAVTERQKPVKSIVDRGAFETPNSMLRNAGLLFVVCVIALRVLASIFKGAMKPPDGAVTSAAREKRERLAAIDTFAELVAANGGAPSVEAYMRWRSPGVDVRATRDRQTPVQKRSFADGKPQKECYFALAAGSGCSLVGVSADQYAAAMVLGSDDSAQGSGFPLDVTKRPRSASAESADAAVLEAAFGERHGVALVANRNTPRTGVSTSVIAWGAGDSGQVEVPFALRGKVEVRAIAAGARHSVAVDSTGTVTCWGDNASGQCSVPYRLRGARRVAAGGNATFALVGSGVVWAWGDVRFGQCSVPPSLASAMEIDGGDRHAVALAPGGAVVCWGDDSSGQCRVPDLGEPCLHVSAGGAHTVLLTRSGRIVTFGSNSKGQCASPSSEYGMFFVEIAAGSEHSIALRSDGFVVGWGRDEHGQPSPPSPLPLASEIVRPLWHIASPKRGAPSDESEYDIIENPPSPAVPTLLHRDSEIEFTVVPTVLPQ